MRKKVKKIVVVTGTRADYGIYVPLLKKIEKDPVLELGLIVTGMHLSPIYGYTINEIKADKYKIIGTIDILLQGSTSANMARSIGLGIIGMTQVLETNQPDLLFVLGDRGEMLAAAIAASHLNIPVAHLHGGEVSGSIDESVRHAISKLSHIHFPATAKSAERLKKMGEDEWRIHQVGALRLDTILKASLPSFEEVRDKYGLGFIEKNNYFLLVYHPVTTEVHSLKDQIKNVLDALIKHQKPIICILPNSDYGTEEITAVYNEYKQSNIKFIKNFNHLDYLTVLKHSLALIGNSSSGIIEAASFHVPVLNIGNRQKGRERSGNVVDVTTALEDIEKGLNQVLSESFRQSVSKVSNVYGDGKASDRIVKRIKDLIIDDTILNKIIAY
ncbi:UDP-N-acetylglucosamine 2-epimerase [Aeribacillus pallidus]|uniref:UDP-N-acetylglucosamine 2-epimerase n=1 Tax=Aeribacillus TaxID=1055323 RepID=UPI0007B4CE98|nr:MULTISPECIES: UDP-N-acetylglucosamine 2-epimerase [Aeribacillus]KZM55116.1 UDP-N-acetyl glucosamine 2-epimerase [Aeribacillus pallidus]MED0650955.1 UDP-N-acetylglucosamine 2-epimerase [Aeribacillus composti]MED4488524.1 UDP-N-acetylglucosamine 2-epimerase [Aeribacillus pallidus]